MAISTLLGRLTVLYHTSEDNLPKLVERNEAVAASQEQLFSTEDHSSSFNSADSVRAPKKRRKTGEMIS